MSAFDRELQAGGWPRLPGEWAPWHDGLIFPIALRREAPHLSDEQIETIGQRVESALIPVLNDAMRRQITRDTMMNLRSQMTATVRALYASGELPVMLDPVFTLGGNNVLQIHWRKMSASQ